LMWNWWIGSIPPPAAMISSLVARLASRPFGQSLFGSLFDTEVGREPSR
jgi:hypothetical protein